MAADSVMWRSQFGVTVDVTLVAPCVTLGVRQARRAGQRDAHVTGRMTDFLGRASWFGGLSSDVGRFSGFTRLTRLTRLSRFTPLGPFNRLSWRSGLGGRIGLGVRTCAEPGRMPSGESRRLKAPRVLMLTHAFPPAGGSGANRALAFARYLPMYGWRPLVLTVRADWAVNRDDELLKLVPGHVDVVRTASWEARARRQSGPEGLPGAGVGRPAYAAGDGSTGVRNNPGEDSGGRFGRRGRDLRLGARWWTGRLRREARAVCAPLGVTQVGRGGGPDRAVLRRAKQQLGHLRRFPDAHLGWLPFAVAAGRGLDVDLIYSSSGPFTSHLVALILSKLLRKPWVAELRDGWYLWNRAIFTDYPGWRGLLERRLEGAAIRSADRVLLVTERMAAAFRAQYADLPAEHFCVVSNGFDPRQIAAPDRMRHLMPSSVGVAARTLESARHGHGGAAEDGVRIELDGGGAAGETPDAGGAGCVECAGGEPGAVRATVRFGSAGGPSEGSRVFEVVHAGALYYGRSIARFLTAAEQLSRDNREFSERFRLSLIGTLDAAARGELERHPLVRRVHFEGQLPHAAVMQRLRRASTLLLVANTTPLAEATVPGKLFEYLAIGRPVLAIAPRASSTADVLARTGGGWLAAADEPEQITRALRAAFQDWQRPESHAPDPRQVAQYSRVRLAGELARVFDGVLLESKAARRG